MPIKEVEGGYKPSGDEAFMNERQKDYFRRKLIAWKEDILRESQGTLVVLQRESENHPDLADRASSETGRSIELRARDRQRKLIAKIDAALERLDDGTYGYCEETGEPIGLKRLDARPIATLFGRGTGTPRTARTDPPRELTQSYFGAARSRRHRGHRFLAKVPLLPGLVS